MEQKKREIIEAINEIRKKLGLEPYSLEYLEAKDTKELEKLFSQYFQMREDYRKGLKEEKPRFKLSLKTGLLVGVLVMVAISFLIMSQSVWEEGISLPFLPTQEKPKETEVYEQIDFNIQTSFKGENNNYVIVIQNNGTENITFSQILIDDREITYEVWPGSYLPLRSMSVAYLEVSKECDGLSHKIKIISDRNKSIETVLDPC